MSDYAAVPSSGKQPASAHGAVVVTNHPLGSAAGLEMLAAGGNAVDAAVAALLALTVVEPMMVGLVGGGISHLRLAGGRHLVVDALACAGADMHAQMYQPVHSSAANCGADLAVLDVAGRHNLLGPHAVATPGNLAGWHHMQNRWGRLPFADVVQPAIRYARQGFNTTSYLQGAIEEVQGDLRLDATLAQRFLPDGKPLPAGSRLIQGDYAESLQLVSQQGAQALHGGALGDALIEALQRGATEAMPTLSRADLLHYRAIEREPIVGRYRGFEIVGPPPPASSGVHVVQMLNMLEAFEVGAMAFDDPARLHLLAEVMRIAFADRNAHSGDPAFVDVPVTRLTSKEYARQCLAQIRVAGAGTESRAPGAGVRTPWPESRDTTHVTVADRDGNIVCATHTINSLFGARFIVPGAGLIPNNYMCNYDPRPGHALSIAPGKRVPTSMAPMVVRRAGKPVWALGLPGGLRIFPSALQCIVNLIDHGMPIQRAIDAARVWTHGDALELEAPLAAQKSALQAIGHTVKLLPCIGGGLNALAFGQDGGLSGAACWRADGTVAALGGGLAQPGVRFRL